MTTITLEATKTARARVAVLVETIRGLPDIEEHAVSEILGRRLHAEPVDGLWSDFTIELADDDAIARIELSRRIDTDPAMVQLTLTMPDGCPLGRLDLAQVWGHGRTVRVEPREPPYGVVVHSMFTEGREELFAVFHGPGKSTLKRLVLTRSAGGAGGVSRATSASRQES